MQKSGKYMRTEGDSDSDEEDQNKQEFSLNQQIFFTDGGRTIKVIPTIFILINLL